MRLLLLFVCGFLACLASPSGHMMWKTTNGPTHQIYGWRKQEKTQPDELVKIVVAVRQQNTDEMEKVLRQVSDPKSPEYGQWLTREQVGDIIRPTPASIKSVRMWLERLGGREITFTPNENWVKCYAKVKDVEAMIPSVQFFQFSHPRRSRQITRSIGSFEVPIAVSGHIDIIYGISDFPYVRRRASDPVTAPHDDWTFLPKGGDSTLQVNVVYPNDLPSPSFFELQIIQTLGNNPVFVNYSVSNLHPTQKGNDTLYTLNADGLMNGAVNVSVRVTSSSGTSDWKYYLSPVVITPWITASMARSLYDIPVGLQSQHPNNSQSVAEFDEQYYSPSDLTRFASLMGVPVPPVTVMGTNDPTSPGVESTLDIQWIITTGSNVSTTFWYTESGFLGEWASEVEADPNPPLVHSISYGEPEEFMTQSDIDRLNSDFQQLGARGLSIISTSGDLGVGDGAPRGCSHDTPDFPSSSPYTTSLGATTLARDYYSAFCSTTINGAPAQCPYNTEVPCSAGTGQGFTTGGGFSSKNKQAWYQADVVDTYLNTETTPPDTWFSADGRGYNDVTALGFNIVIIYGGTYAVVGGTSASGPIFAGTLAMLNDVRLQAGKSSLGFVNPFLYSTAVDPRYVGAFNPITIGDNNCKETSSLGEVTCCEYGFSSSDTTWDPLNGLGSPDFGVLQRAVSDLP